MMAAQQITPNTQTRQENAWTNGNSTNPVPHVDAESFPSLDTPRENVSAKALQEESFGTSDTNSLGKTTPQKRRKNRRDQPRRDIKRVNGIDDGGMSGFSENGASETISDSSKPLGDMNLQNGHMQHENTLASNGSPRGGGGGRFERVFDDVPHDNGYHRQDHRYNKYGRRHNQNRRRYNRFDNHDRMGDSDPLSPRSGSNEDEELSRRHNGGSPDRYNRRRRDDGGRRFDGRRDRFRDERRWGRHPNYGRRNYNHDRRHRNYENGNEDMSSTLDSGMGGPNAQNNNPGMSGAGSMGHGGFGTSPMNTGIGGVAAAGVSGGNMAGPYGASPHDYSANYGAPTTAAHPFGGAAASVNPASSFNYPMMGYPQQMFPYQQPPMQFPANPVMPMYTMPGGQMVMLPFPGMVGPASTDLTSGIPGANAAVVPQQVGVVTAETNGDGMTTTTQTNEMSATSGSAAIDPIAMVASQMEARTNDDFVGGIGVSSDEPGEVSDMTKLSEPTAEHSMTDANDQAQQQTIVTMTSENDDSGEVVGGDVTAAVTQPNVGFGDAASGAYPQSSEVSSVVMQNPMQQFGLSGLWPPGGYNPLLMSGMPAGVIPLSSDPTYTTHMKQQSAQVAVTDTGTHFPAHGDECEIPRGPYFCVKVACVATGLRHDDRDVGQVVVVDFNCNVVCNVYVKSEKPIVSYLDPLTSLAPGTWIEQYGLPLSEAKRIVKESVPTNAVIVGQNVYQDLNLLDMKKGENYRASIDLRDLWHHWNDHYSSFTHFSLEHQAKCILGHPGIEKHNAPLDATLTMQLFTAYLEARAQKSGTKLQDMRRFLIQYQQKPSFSRRNPTFEKVCMGNRKSCKCGAPPLNAKGTPFLISARKSQSAGATPIGSPTTPRTPRVPLEVEPPTNDGENGVPPASAPAASTIVEPPVDDAQEGETVGNDSNGNHVDSSLIVSE